MIPAQDVQFLGASDDIQILGPAEPATAHDYVTMLGASSPQDVMCAEQVKGEFYGSAACTVGMIGTGLLGVYKLFKGKPAAGVTSIVGAGIFYVVGAALATSLTKKFTACTGLPEQPKLPSPAL